MFHRTDLNHIVKDELRRHPRATVRDLQKLVMQSALGVDHLLADRERFRKGLLTEWRDVPVSTGPGDPIQIVDPDGRTARLHLAPCRDLGLDPTEMAHVLSEQALKCAPWSEVVKRWAQLVEGVIAGEINGWCEDDLAALPPEGSVFHHSVRYGFAAYRVINDVRDPVIRRALRAWGISA